MSARRLLLLGMLAVLAAPRPAVAGEHVRVVLDVSGSMRTNDPGRLAVLATALLYDLAAPNPTLDDSFEVLPFDAGWRWSSPKDPPPASTRERIRAEHEGRGRLLEQLSRLAYDAHMTYFYPGLKAAVDDLKQTPGGARDVRIIVLVTDGVPEAPTREREAELIRSEIVPALQASGIGLYVLAFSTEAERQRDFLDAMVRGGGGPVGEVFLDPDGRSLVASMITIFARSFGYTADAARELPAARTLDLEAGTRGERAAVVATTPGPQPPGLRLGPPAGGAINAPAGVVSAAEPGGSYSLVWVLSPAPGEHRLGTEARSGSVAVLRPARLELEVLPAPPHTQTELTLAKTPFRLRVRARSAGSEGGDPGPFELSFRALGERLERVGKGGESHAWRGDRGAPQAGAGTPTPEGRVYEIEPEWTPNRRAPGEVYAGYLELEARRGAAVLGGRLGEQAHRVEVHPLLALAPLPLAAYVSERALERHEKGCTRFTLTLAAGELPHPQHPELSLRALLAPADKEIFERELRQAFFTLDGVPLAVEGHAAAEVAAWSKGRTLGRSELLGEHELCIQVGEPTRADPGAALELPLELTLLESPYDDFEVVAPFTAKILLSPPSALDRWRPLLGLGAALAAVLALSWLMRGRPGLPNDLRVALGGDPRALVPRLPGAAAVHHRLFGLLLEHPLVAEGGATIGWLIPAPEQLFQVRLAAGVRLTHEDGRPLALTRGLASLEARRLYRLEGTPESLWLRLDYDPRPDLDPRGTTS